MVYLAILTFISKFCLGDSAFVIFVPCKGFNEGLIGRGSVTSQKFKFVNMGLVCISRKDLYGVVEAKTMLLWPGGLFLFVLSGYASLSHNITNLVFVTSSLPFSIQ